MCVCVYIYIYIYIYTDVYVCTSVCVHGLVAKEGDLISGIFEVVPECPEDFSLSTLGAKPTQRAVPMKTCKTRREG